MRPTPSRRSGRTRSRSRSSGGRGRRPGHGRGAPDPHRRRGDVGGSGGRAVPRPTSSSRTTATTPTRRSAWTSARVAALPELLPEVRDPLLRQLLWSTLWQMTRDARLPAARFLALVLELLPPGARRRDRPGRRWTRRAARSPATCRRRAASPRRTRSCTAPSALLDSLPPGDLRRMWLRAAIDAVAQPGRRRRCSPASSTGRSGCRRSRSTRRCAGRSSGGVGLRAARTRRHASPPSSVAIRRTGASGPRSRPRSPRRCPTPRPRPGGGSMPRATARSTGREPRCGASTTLPSAPAGPTSTRSSSRRP